MAPLRADAADTTRNRRLRAGSGHWPTEPPQTASTAGRASSGWRHPSHSALGDGGKGVSGGLGGHRFKWSLSRDPGRRWPRPGGDVGLLPPVNRVRRRVFGATPEPDRTKAPGWRLRQALASSAARARPPAVVIGQTLRMHAGCKTNRKAGPTSSFPLVGPAFVLGSPDWTRTSDLAHCSVYEERIVGSGHHH